jgi:hypothetical protein
MPGYVPRRGFFRSVEIASKKPPEAIRLAVMPAAGQPPRQPWSWLARSVPAPRFLQVDRAGEYVGRWPS